MLEGIVVTVVGGLILAGVLGMVALGRRSLRSRSDVRFIGKVTDFGTPPPNSITWRVGLVLDVEVHVVRNNSMRITEVGLELANGGRISLDTALNLDKPIAAPDFVTASDYMKGVQRRVAAAGSPVRGFYAIARPDRTFREKVPRGWKGFPEIVPARDVAE